MKIITLGTGAAVPTLQRGHPATLLWRKGKYFLFDCGEATQLQFRRAGLKFSHLEAMFISHLHGDHILGIMGLLMSLELSDRQRDINICGPFGLKEYLEVSGRIMSTFFNFQINVMELQNGVVLENDGYTVRAFHLNHRVSSTGYSFVEDDRPGKFNVEEAKRLGIPEGPIFGKLQRGESVTLSDGRIILPEQIVAPPVPGRKVVYCGDTRPCDEAVEMARNADVLIYEGTFAPDAIDKAKVSGHSTTEEAAEVAKKANVKKLIINHISSRYQDDAKLLGKSRDIFPDIIVARDFMEIEI